MKKGRLALVDSPEFDYCTNYHCVGDCGLRGHGWQHKTNERSCMNCGTQGCGHQDIIKCGQSYDEWTPKQ
jgi:hypothetical protein